MSQEKILSVAEIFGVADLVERVIPIPQWGGAVKIRGFTKREIDDLRERATVNGTLDAAKLEMAIFLQGLIEPRLTEEQYRQLVTEKSGGPYYLILNAIMAESGLTESAAKAAQRSFT